MVIYMKNRSDYQVRAMNFKKTLKSILKPPNRRSPPTVEEEAAAD
jgi:hypothetical protein